MIQRRERWLVWSLAVVLVAASFSFMFWVLQGGIRRPNQHMDFARFFAQRTPQQPGDSKESRLAAEIPLDVRIGPSTEIVRKTLFKKCGDVETTREMAGGDLLGLSREGFQARNKELNIEEFTPKRVVVLATVDGLCQQHSSYRYLGIMDGFLAVYEGKPGQGGRAVEITDIEVRSLPEKEIRDLQKGVPVSSQRELLEILQGLAVRGPDI